MINLILAISILNTALIIYLLMQLGREKEKITELLNSKGTEEIPSDEDKKHIDDMLKMREMYESD